MMRPSILDRSNIWPYSYLLILYLCGVALWGLFFAWGHFPYQFHDWSEVNVPRLAFVQNALRQNEIPFQVNDGSSLRCDCDRYFSTPDGIATPFLIFLKWLPIEEWVFLDMLALYSLGYWGLLSLRRQLHFSLPFFTLAYLLFFFNGHILAHLAVGHVTWGGYFLFPWFVLLVDRFAKGESSWRWRFAMAALLFAILLQGSYHQFVWCLIFLGILGLVYFRRLGEIFLALVLAGLASAFRLLPPALSIGKYDSGFYGGYASPFAVYEALTHWVPPAEAMPFMHQGSNLGFWEFDLYIGKIGLWILVLAGVAWLVLQIRERKLDLRIVPVAVLVILSMDGVFAYFHQIPIPFLQGERVTSRMISLPFIVFIFFAVAALQSWVDRFPYRRWLFYLLMLPLLLEQAYTLLQRLVAWRIPSTAAAFPYAYTDISTKLPANHPDPLYYGILGGGLALSLLTLSALAWLAFREQREKKL